MFDPLLFVELDHQSAATFDVAADSLRIIINIPTIHICSSVHNPSTHAVPMSVTRYDSWSLVLGQEGRAVAVKPRDAVVNFKFSMCTEALSPNSYSLVLLLLL